MESSQSQDLSIVKTLSGHFEHEWLLNFVSTISMPICSPVFQVKLGEDYMVWRLLLILDYLKSSCESSDSNVLCLELIDTNKCDLGVEGEFIFLNTNHLKIISLSLNLIPFYKGNRISLKLLISRDNLLKNISEDKLRIISQIRVFNSPNPLQSFITGDLTKLRSERDSSDVQIIVKGQKFHAHKIILAARSPVFSAMFQHNMKETITGTVKIDDLKPKVFEELLKYFYMEDFNLNDNAVKLLEAANKYDVKDLRGRCEWAIIRRINKENCYELLSLSHLYSARTLKNRTISFISSNNLWSLKDGLAKIEDSSLLKELIQALGSVVCRQRLPSKRKL